MPSAKRYPFTTSGCGIASRSAVPPQTPTRSCRRSGPPDPGAGHCHGAGVLAEHPNVFIRGRRRSHSGGRRDGPRSPPRFPDEAPTPILDPPAIKVPAADYLAPVDQPPARDVPALKDVAAPKVRVQVHAPVADKGGPVEEVASAEAAPGAGPASPAVDPQVVAAPAAAAAPRPVATSTPEPAAVAAEKSSGAAGFNPLPLVFTLVGILIAAGLVLMVRRSLPLRRD